MNTFKTLSKATAIVMIAVLSVSMTSCNSLSRNKGVEKALIEASPYCYVDEDGEELFEIFFNEDRTFRCDYYEGSWQDPDVYMTIEGKWRVIQTDKIVSSIVELEYDLKSLSPYDKDYYDYFEEENRTLKVYNKNGDAYGFGPGEINQNYDFVKFDYNNPKVILHSIGGEYMDFDSDVNKQSHTNNQMPDLSNQSSENATKSPDNVFDFNVTQLEAIVIPESKYALCGGEYEAQIVLSAVDTTKSPSFYVNGNRLGDNGVFRTSCGSVGTFKYRGQIVLPRNDGSQLEFPFESEYSVGMPNATVSNSELNVVYRGYDNHINISVPGVSDDQITASCDGGTIQKTGKEYIVKPGNGTELRIRVTAKLNGNNTPMGEYKFRIKPLPKPSAFVVVNGTVHEDVRIPHTLVINPDCHIEANYGKDGLLNVNFRITNFMIMSPDGTIDGSGNKFSAKQMESIRKLKKGDYLNIVNIRAAAPSGAEIKLAPIPLILN